MRVLIWITVIAAALWSGLWFVASTSIRNGTESWFAEQAAQGITAEKSALVVQGFPSRVDVTVNDLVLADPAQGRDLNECFMRVAVRTADKAQARRVAQHLPWMMVGGPPDVVYIPPSPPRELTAIWPMRIQRAPIESRISVEVLEP